MKIRINGVLRQPLTLSLPTGLIRIAAPFAERALRKHNVFLSSKQTAAFLQAIHVYSRTHKDWVLAEISSSDGEQITIIL